MSVITAPQRLFMCIFCCSYIATQSELHALICIVKVKVTLRLTISQSVGLGVEPHLGLMTRYLLLFDTYGLVFLGPPLYMLLALASVVFLGAESLGTCDRILLSHI
jgi:hypothetical protein